MTLAAPELERKTLSHQLVRHLTEMIVTHQLEPGTLLPPEKALAEMFGVSRMVVRESVRILDAIGLVVVRHGVGSFVNATPAWRVEEPLHLLLRSERQSLLHWLEVRKVAEVGFAELAAERATAENLQALTAAISRMRSTAGDPAAEIAADLEFHLEVGRASGNPLVITLMRPLLQPLREHLVATVGLPHALERAIAEHETIHQAIAAHRPAEAAAAMRAHLSRVVDEIETLDRQTALLVGSPTTDGIFGDGAPDVPTGE